MWNDRFKQFTGPTTETCMWKNVKFELWIEQCMSLTRHTKSLNKLDLTSQTAILSRILYKHHNQMRRDKPFQLLKRANRLVTRYNETKILHHLTTYADILATLKRNKSSLVKDVHIPSREFTFFLVELLYGTYRLLPKVVGACEEAFVSLDSHMRHGFFVSFNLFSISSVSRMWSVFKVISEHKRLLFQLFTDIVSTCYDAPVSYPMELQKIMVDGLDGKCNSSNKIDDDKKEMEAEVVSKEEDNSSLDIPPSPISTLLVETNLAKNFATSAVCDFEDLGESVSRSSIIKLRNNNNNGSHGDEGGGQKGSQGNKNNRQETEFFCKDIPKTVEKLNDNVVVDTGQKLDSYPFVCTKSTLESKSTSNITPHNHDTSRNNCACSKNGCKYNEQKKFAKKKKIVNRRHRAGDGQISSIDDNCSVVKRRNVSLGFFRSERYHRLVPYPTTSLSRGFKVPFTCYNNMGVRSLNVMRKCYAMVREQTRQLKHVDEVREALGYSASKQETLYLIMRLRRLLRLQEKKNKLYFN